MIDEPIDPAPEPALVEIRAACDAGRFTDAATQAIRVYGDEVLGYLAAVLGNEVDAGDAFSETCELLWRSLPTFRWECSLRTWLYTLARQSVGHVRRDPHRRRAVGLSEAGLTSAIAEVRTRTASFLRTENRDRVAALRASLAPDDQTLLILRINRGLAWRDIARVLAGDDVADAELTRAAARIRKRFERLKDELRARARAP